jgi:hypothetical protein
MEYERLDVEVDIFRISKDVTKTKGKLKLIESIENLMNFSTISNSSTMNHVSNMLAIKKNNYMRLSPMQVEFLSNYN